VDFFVPLRLGELFQKLRKGRIVRFLPGIALFSDGGNFLYVRLDHFDHSLSLLDLESISNIQGHHTVFSSLVSHLFEVLITLSLLSLRPLMINKTKNPIILFEKWGFHVSAHITSSNN
jgi:hypothetical protein